MTDTANNAPAPDAAAVAAAAAAAAAGAKPWHEGIQGEDLGHLQNRGWDKLDAKAAAVAAAKAHREAEKVIGVPANQLLRLPKDAADVEGNARLTAALGVPTDAKEYDFTTIKFADGEGVDDAFANVLRPALQAARVSKDAAPGVVKAIVNYLDGVEATEVKDAAANLATEREALRISWGSNAEPNLVVAKNAAATLNIDPEAIQALEKQIGYAKVMEMFRNIGQRMGEDTFVSNGKDVRGNNIPMSLEAAEATLAEKQNDYDFVKRLNSGDALAMKEFNNLTTMIATARRARAG